MDMSFKGLHPPANSESEDVEDKQITFPVEIDMHFKINQRKVAMSAKRKTGNNYMTLTK